MRISWARTAEAGGIPLVNRVGHAFFKRRMREDNAIFGGEVTGHYYFRDNFYADNGFIPALLILELMSKKGQTLHELLKLGVVPVVGIALTMRLDDPEGPAAGSPGAYAGSYLMLLLLVHRDRDRDRSADPRGVQVRLLEPGRGEGLLLQVRPGDLARGRRGDRRAQERAGLDAQVPAQEPRLLLRPPAARVGRQPRRDRKPLPDR